MNNILKDVPDDLDSNLSELYGEVLADDTPSQSDHESSLDYLSAQQERYTPEEEVGRGGAKKILRVYDNRARRYLAMALPRTKAGSSDHDSFIRESWITAQLDHPNIINIHEIGINTENIPFFTMDLQTEDSLEHILRRLKNKDESYLRRFPRKVLIDFFIKICDAIAYAHSINILHLDIKPANVQIGEYGEVIVCDWGLAKFFGGRKSQNLNRDLLELDLIEEDSSLVKGTPGYMAPEQIIGEQASIISDVYSLSALLYHLVTFEPIITSKGVTIALTQTALGDIKKPEELTHLSEGLSSIIMKGLSTKPEDRYQSVIDLKNDLVKYLDGYVTNAENPGLVKEALFFFRRNKTICIQALLFIILIISSTAVFISNLQQSWKSEQLARVEAEENAFKHQQALALYKRAKAQGAKVKKEFSGVLLGQAQIFNNANYANIPEKLLQSALKGAQYKLEQNPDDKSLKDISLISLFLLQRYEEAQQYLAESHKFKYLKMSLNTALKEAQDYNGRNVPLTTFVAALKGLREFGPATQATAYRAIAYDLKTRADFNNYELVLEEAFMLWNDHWRERTFQYDKKNQHLKVSGDNFANLGITDKFGRILLLPYIPIKHLDVSNSEVKDLTYLYGSKIETLDIRRTFVRDLKPLRHIPTLKIIIVNPRQFSEDLLSVVPNHIKIIKKN
ncbi:serine/threonine-protein kinase [Lentisphaera araneosa HTCC2155]|uniref:Serine/threonine-protein kinase n=1 Tax=Lentisphaera araneosa HTCC2155 TaxID=313628 RepID=A6DG98_9BACT|nr:serine/threonine-protein kinase [Lentisphaera araneosa]EDM29215.1 serine/threonine-protein kinase [Lentisphaera araneosa HTCC2155]